MTQMSFLTEHTGEFSVLFLSLIIVLLFVTLHRIKRITRMIQEITGNTKDKDARASDELEEAGHFLSLQEENETQETQEKTLRNTEDAALLSEVLEEVFS